MRNLLNVIIIRKYIYIYIHCTNSGCGEREAHKLVRYDTLKASTRYSNYLDDYWPCAGALSTVNVIGTQMRDRINSSLARCQLMVYVDAALEREMIPVNTYQIQSEYEE